MRLGERRIEFKGPARRGLRLRHRPRGRQDAVQTQQVVTVGEPRKRQCIGRVAFDGCREVVDAFGETVARPLVPVESALQVESIGLGIRRISLHDQPPLFERSCGP